MPGWGTSTANELDISQACKMISQCMVECRSMLSQIQSGPTKTQSNMISYGTQPRNEHYDVIKWKNFPHYWPFVQGIHYSLVNSPHKGQWRGALMFSLTCAWINGWVNNCEAGDLRRHCTHCDQCLKLSKKKVEGPHALNVGISNTDCDATVMERYDIGHAFNS